MSLFDFHTVESFADVPIRDMRVMQCPRQAVESFIEANHYSGSINGVITDYCFALRYGNDLVGACAYGRLAMANQWKKYGDSPEDVIELRRLCCVDSTKRNAESFLIGASIRWLKKNTPHKTIVTYADSEHGHDGTIYKATNFKYSGFIKGAPMIEHNGKLYHDKAIRTMYKGKPKPFAVRLLAAIDSGDAVYKTTSGKHCYTYRLNK